MRRWPGYTPEAQAYEVATKRAMVPPPCDRCGKKFSTPGDPA